MRGKGFQAMTSQTFVKICGLNDAASVDAAIDGGADMLGLVFFEKSPRHVSLSKAETLAAHIREKSDKVAITTLLVDPKDSVLEDVTKAVRPDFIQLHGSESPARVEWAQNAYHVRVIKAVGVANSDDIHAAMAFDGVANQILFDAKPAPTADLPGGNGLTFDWTVLDGLSDRLSYMLSGGLNPDNVGAAIRLTGAPAVDVSSGVETRPGAKDPELIRRFIHAAKAAKKGV